MRADTSARMMQKSISKEKILLLENQIAQLQKGQLEMLRYSKATVEGIKKILGQF